MTWWQTLIVAAVPALVTLIGLLIQNRSNHAREKERRRDELAERERDRLHQAEQARAERNHQVAMARDERTHAASAASEAYVSQYEERQRQRVDDLNERWRDERRAAHVTLLATLDAALKSVDRALALLSSDDNDRTLRQDSLDALSDSLRDELRTALANVQVIGTEQTKAKAEECSTKIQELDFAIWAATQGGAIKGRLHERAAACERLRTEYVEAVRSDLGTNASEYDSYGYHAWRATQPWDSDGSTSDPWASESAGDPWASDPL